MSRAASWARFALVLAAVLIVTWFVVGVERARHLPTGGELVRQLPNASQFRKLAETMWSAGMPASPGEHWTVLVPVDAAFARQGISLDALPLKDLLDLLGRHVIRGTHSIATLQRERFVKTVGGSRVEVVTTPGGTWINSARIVQGDLATSDGVVHLIDRLNVDNPL